MQFKPGTQTISWFQKEYKQGTITLRPPYQRKPVWAARQKCYLIESILMGLPVPEIFIHTTTNASGDTIHAVVDGQQRIRTVLQFLGLRTLGPDGTPEIDEDEFVGFTLDTFEKRTSPSPWLGMRFSDLSLEDRVKLFEYNFHIRYLTTTDESELRSMFTRLNRYLTALNPQELRHATYMGPFPKLAETLADNEFWLRSGLMTRALVRRLGDVEFVSQLLIGLIHGPEGGGAAVIDEYYRLYEDYDLEEGIPDHRRTRKLFDLTLQTIQDLFPDLDEGTLRWVNKADFYTLFVALGQVLREIDGVPPKSFAKLRSVLEKWSKDVDRHLAEENAAVDPAVAEYASAVEKGVNDKARRADRHRALVGLIEAALGVSDRVLHGVHRLPKRQKTGKKR